MSERTLFTRLLAGELPCHKVYEDDLVFAILDIAPLAEGHVLLIPKEPAKTFDALSEASAAALGRALPGLCRAVLRATGTTAFNLLQNNGSLAHQAVPHVHIHIIPKRHEDEGLGVVWQPGQLTSEHMERLQAAVVAALAA